MTRHTWGHWSVINAPWQFYQCNECSAVNYTATIWKALQWITLQRLGMLYSELHGNEWECSAVNYTATIGNALQWITRQRLGMLSSELHGDDCECSPVNYTATIGNALQWITRRRLGMLCSELHGNDWECSPVNCTATIGNALQWITRQRLGMLSSEMHGNDWEGFVNYELALCHDYHPDNHLSTCEYHACCCWQIHPNFQEKIAITKYLIIFQLIIRCGE